ncbi:MAG: tRNA (adenosine(37)-N6)-threonylcarbamoyltransferase complex ATPase subunit type 1 TsaE [Oscillospiraceae bacterium]|jgi:tRNA threonylcarbamoyladenosine biosynthesis protein TsaE|nr:tRNA (adenosine(37)-N6)-threonylcarbamoyltransferase complex ATPase subunit type 1 TsaE [Oscillospiraceae bacterium]
MTYITNSEAETETLGHTLGETLRAGSVVALTGSLGAGKTAFTRGIASALGCGGAVTSPTYAIVNEYAARLPVVHLDLYRLGSENELFDVGFGELISRGGVAVVEWAELAEPFLPPDAVRVKISRISDNVREITIEGARREPYSRA